MNKKRTICTAILILTLTFNITACGRLSNAPTTFEFTFSPASAANYENHKTLHINEDIERLVLESELELDAGELVIQIINVENAKIEWSGRFTENTSFTIELNDIKADTELAFTMEASQTNRMKLTVDSDVRLAKVRESHANGIGGGLAETVPEVGMR